jgi:pyruvate dehydrogenase E2 component (dihydrolipoamide acetyltransferase)
VTATFVMPMLGADMAAGRLAHWYRAPGDEVRRGDIVAAVETDKGVIDVECFATGVLGTQLVAEGQEVPVGTPLATILAEGEEPSAAQPAPQPAPAAAPAEAQAAPVPPVAPAPAPETPALAPAALLHPHASPLALRFAREHGLDIAQVTGTGPHGRTILRDVDAAIRHPGARAAAPSRVRSTPRARELAAQLGIDIAAVTGSGPGGRVMRRDVEAARPSPVEDDPRARMRRAIAAAMSRSNREIPHYHVSETIDLGRTSEWLTAENERRPLPERLLIGVLLVKAVALALREHPSLNAVWRDERAVPCEAIHVGVAVSLREGGLIAPALHDADRCSVGDLMASFRDVVGRARRGGLRASELSDPTITVTSLGEGGAEEVHGVIFPPQVALVGFGRIVVRPWVVDGAVVPRPVVRTTLSADHRASDGHAGSAFLRTLDRLLQEPAAL